MPLWHIRIAFDLLDAIGQKHFEASFGVLNVAQHHSVVSPKHFPSTLMSNSCFRCVTTFTANVAAVSFSLGTDTNFKGVTQDFVITVL